MAVSYAGELARWNIETTIVVPDGTNHFANAGKPGDSVRLNEYTSGPTATLADEIIQGLHELLFLSQTSRRLLMQSSKL